MLKLYATVLSLLTIPLFSNQTISDLLNEEKPYHSVTYIFSGGRFGDQLVSYMHAKWISYKYGIPLLYRPFAYSHFFVLDDVETRYPGEFVENKNHTLHHGESIETLFTRVNTPPYTLMIPYFPANLWEIQNTTSEDGWSFFPVDWDDPVFRGELKRLLTLKEPINEIPLPKDRITVALHIRIMEDPWDIPLEISPLKVPNHEFYIQALEKLIQHFQGKPLYVHIFTNVQNTRQIMRQYARRFAGYPIQWGCNRTTPTPWDSYYETPTVLEDFIALTRFDCLVRGESNFSATASKITDYKVEIIPETFHIDLSLGRHDYVVVDSIKMIIKE